MPHYDRHADPSCERNAIYSPTPEGFDDENLDVAAEALRGVEVEAAQPEPEIPDVASLNASQLESMNIDDLRVVAKELDINDRATITDKDELIAAIRQVL